MGAAYAIRRDPSVDHRGPPAVSNSDVIRRTSLPSARATKTLVYCGVTKARVGVLKIFGEILRERRFGRGPAIVRFVLFDPLLAVVALVRLHLWHGFMYNIALKSSTTRMTT